MIRRVFRRRYHKIVLETPFDANSPGHERLLDLDLRLEKEQEIAAELERRTGSRFAAGSVIVDIPEAQTFEVELPVIGGDGFYSFAQSDSLFGEEAASAFSRALRKIRVIVAEELASQITADERLLQ